MKRIHLFILTLIAMTFAFTIFASASEVTTYTDAPEKSVLTYKETELVVFNDGFVCPSYYIFEDSTEFKTNYEWINQKASKSYTDASVVELCVPTGVLTGGYFKRDSSFTALKKLDTGATLTKTNGDFWNNQTLETVIFGKGFTNEALGAYFITGGKVTHIIFSDDSSVTTLPSQFFAGLTTLQGIYLGSSITNIGSGTFQNMGSSNVYLMNTPEDTQAPEIYYFKSILQEGNFYGFKTNATTTTWVFREEQKGVGSGWNFDSASNLPENLVFLTDATYTVTVQDAIGSTKMKIFNFYFPNIQSSEVTKMTVSPSSTYYFGDSKKMAYNGSWQEASDMTTEEHIVQAPKTTEPTCTENSKTIEACFCETIKSVVENQGTALGHDYFDDNNCITDNLCTRCDAFELASYTEHKKVESYSYDEGYDKDGLYLCSCEHEGCRAIDVLDGDEKSVLAPIVVSLGYSVREVSLDRICVGFEINRSALAKYNAYLGEGNELQIGVMMANANSFGDEFMAFDGEKYTIQSTQGIQVSIASTSYKTINCMITGFDTEERKKIPLVMSMYIIDNDGVSYVQAQNTSAGTVEKGEQTLNIVTVNSVSNN